MSLRRARSPEKLVEWVRAKFAPSQNKKWKSNFKNHFANRNARPPKTTEDDDPSLEEFRVRYELGSRSCGKDELIDRAVEYLAQLFSEDVTSRQEAGAVADAERHLLLTTMSPCSARLRAAMQPLRLTVQARRHPVNASEQAEITNLPTAYPQSNTFLNRTI